MSMDETSPNFRTDQGCFDLSFTYRFEAAHRLTKASAIACMTPHGHTWYAKAVFSSESAQVGADDMVAEFSLIKKGWKTFIQETADHSYLHHHEDALLTAMKDHIPNFRGLPFPGDPTTELIAALFFAKIQAMHRELKSARPLPNPATVVIQETPTNTVTLHAGPSLTKWLQTIDERFDGWWQTADPNARHLTVRDPLKSR